MARVMATYIARRDSESGTGRARPLVSGHTATRRKR